MSSSDKSDAEAMARTDETLRRMLKTRPKPHKATNQEQKRPKRKEKGTQK